ncbi:FitA-like ribbon-helix-helix domain-containing protein [Mycolicibacterium peregrinum]|uniref:FitA-like ribbon-helix-helix domain-containing protein n=1 Tax=Mycolicibacterium peregrinum TaxID=43304 RepID=UPI000B4B74D9|nr:antitoxin [Mycolicibacterium peregrinum]
MIRNLPEGTKAALRVRAERHHHSVEAEARAILTTGLVDEDIPMSVLLAADDEGRDIDFEPERLGLTARTPEL